MFFFVGGIGKIFLFVCLGFWGFEMDRVFVDIVYDYVMLERNTYFCIKLRFLDFFLILI